MILFSNISFILFASQPGRQASWESVKEVGSEQRGQSCQRFVHQQPSCLQKGINLNSWRLKYTPHCCFKSMANSTLSLFSFSVSVSCLGSTWIGELCNEQNIFGSAKEINLLETIFASPRAFQLSIQPSSYKQLNSKKWIKELKKYTLVSLFSSALLNQKDWAGWSRLNLSCIKLPNGDSKCYVEWEWESWMSPQVSEWVSEWKV